jgi:hypothetical protein
MEAAEADVVADVVVVVMGVWMVQLDGVVVVVEVQAEVGC